MAKKDKPLDEMLDRAEEGSKNKNKNSRDIAAMDKYKADIDTADQLYGDGQLYDLCRVENEIKFYLAQSAQSLFESGKRFNWIKAREDHGNFMTSLERIGVSQTTANYAMAVVNKFGANSQALGNLGPTKIQLLTVLEERDIEDLVENGAAGSLTIDDVSKMTTRELQAALRQERKKRKEQKTAQEETIAKKEEKINELEQLLRYQEPPTREQVAVAALQRYRDPIIDSMLEATERINRAIAAIDEAQKIPHIPFEALEKLIEPWKESFAVFLEAADDFSDAFNHIHVDKGRG